VRTKRATELTPAGEQLLADARPLLASAEALRRRVGRAARGAHTFTIGFMPGLIVTPAVRALREARPDVTIEVFRTTWDDQTDVIHDGRADVSYVRLPIDQRGLQLCPLMSEPRVAVLPVSHRLADKEMVSVADLAGEHLLQNPDAVPEWRDIATELRSPAEPPSATRPPSAAEPSSAAERRPGPVFRSVEEKLEHVAAGDGIVILPLSTASFYTRPDVTHVAVPEIGPNQVGLAWDSSRRSRLIRQFVAIATGMPSEASPATQSTLPPG
jgi:DNA-binding transcriptional LysR family regulator